MLSRLSLLTSFRLARLCVVLRELTIPVAVVDDGHIVNIRLDMRYVLPCVKGERVVFLPYGFVESL